MEFKEIYIKYKYIIWPSVIGLSSVVVLVLVIIPHLLDYLNMRNQIFDLRNRSSFLDAKAVELSNIDELTSQKDLEVAFAVLPTDQGVLNAMAILQNQIQLSGLQLKNTSFSSGKQKDKESFQLNLTVSGQISSLRDFLIKLQQSARVFQVESIEVQFLKSKLEIEAQVPITVFYQKAPTTLGPIDQKVPALSDAEKQLLSKLKEVVSQTVVSSTVIDDDISVPLGKANPFE